MMNLLRKAGALRGSSLPNNPIFSININSLRQKMSCFQKFKTIAARGRKGISHEMRNTFLVVTVLIITTTYSASLNPPKKEHKQTDNSVWYSGTTATSVANPPSGSADNSFAISISLPDVYSLFWLYNTLTFWASVGLTAYLLPSRSICLFLLITLSLFGSCYMLLTVAVSSDLLYYSQLFVQSSGQWYYSISIVNYVFSSLLALLVAYRIARYVCFKLAITRLKFFIIFSLSFVLIAGSVLTPAMIFTEYMWWQFVIWY